MPRRVDFREIEKLSKIIDSKINEVEVQNFNQFLHLVSPTLTWSWKHLVYLRERLNRVVDGTLKRLIISMPPRHGKSEMTTLHLPPYLLELDNKLRICVAAYNQTLANTFSRRIRRLADQRIILSDERSAVEEWETAVGGVLRAVGILGGITGQGFDLVIIDDPIKSRLEANSQVFRDRIYDWYTNDLYTRLEPNAAIIIIMTRWHKDDLAGRILASDDKEAWEVVNLPALAKENDPLGRKVGEALCLDRYTETDLLRIKSVLGDDDFDALYQGNPTSESGSIFKRSKFQFIPRLQLPKPEFVLQTWDTAFKTGEENDYTVGLTIYYADRKYYIVNRYKDKRALSDIKLHIKEQAARYKPDIILVEDKASGQSIIEDFKLESNLPIMGYNPERDKIARAYAVTPPIDNGAVYILSDADWRTDFITNLVEFPYGEHDDDVDAFTMGLRFLIQRFAYQIDEVSDFDLQSFYKKI